MAEKVSRWVKFKKFLKRNMTPTWAKHFGYQVFAFIVSVVMVVGVADYAVTKTYDEMELTFVDNFTITAHTGAYDTQMNSLESIQAALDNNADVLELDVRQRPDGTVIMHHDIVVTNSEGVPLTEAFALLKGSDIKINLDIKDTKALNNLYELLTEYELVDNSFLTGIEPLNVKAVKESKCADMPYYLNYIPSRARVFFDEYRQKLVELLEETGAIGINCNYKYANSQLSSLLHKKGYKLSVWTVDTERKAKKMLAIEPDNITTKDVDMVKKVIENWGK